MRAEMANVRTHADAALAELAGVREREQALLQRRIEVLERQFREGIADLEQRFLLQVLPCLWWVPWPCRRMSHAMSMRRYRPVLVTPSRCWSLQAEHLKRELLAKIVETKAGCEATIEAKAVQLAAALESTDRCPCVTAAPSTQWWALLAR